MANLWSRTYDYCVPVTKSDSTDDPNGPFAGLLVSVAGNVVVYPRNGPTAQYPITIAVIAGQELHFPVRRVASTNTTATVFGLTSGICQPGSG